jgi:hypothetical protein
MFFPNAVFPDLGDDIVDMMAPCLLKEFNYFLLVTSPLDYTESRDSAGAENL